MPFFPELKIDKWTPLMEELHLAHIVKEIRAHRLTVWRKKYLGHDITSLRQNVLKSGLADFSKDYSGPPGPGLTAAERVLCYCFTNMKQHFFAAKYNFSTKRALFAKLATEGREIVIVDIGCGPATVALAFAEAVPGIPLKYCGIDTAKPMRLKGRELFNAARDSGLIHAESTAGFGTNLKLISSKISPDSVVILSFSYFFGNPSIDAEGSDLIESLVALYNELVAIVGRKQVYIAYTNSQSYGAYKRYLPFLGALKVDFYDKEPHESTIRYCSDRKCDARYVQKITFHREIYWIDP